ncbi:MAG: trehalose-phosphatase, partial [Leptospiraceae bacterium]|nr:trehalose-phosphatase [Leptospiraceae bacterium]
RRLILSVDRLDYTKGLPDRLRAYKKFLQRNPHLVRDTVLVQIAVPSRTQISDYQELKNQVESIVNDIQETFEQETQAPIHFIYRSLPFKRLCAFYMEADIALVTPYFDGMNLVAKEFVAVKKDSGVLILSEHAGAAHELGEALIINPWNPDQISLALEQAVNMSESERTRRMQAMFAKVSRNNIHYWSESFLRDLVKSNEIDASHHGATRVLDGEITDQMLSAFAAAQKPLLLLDYDGTLSEITNLPMSARPDAELLDIMDTLANRLDVDVTVVTGRSREDISDWLGHLPIGFSCEHGLWIKWHNESEWHKMLPADQNLNWWEIVQDLMDQYNLSTPGSFTEVKEASLAWHYRLCDPSHGQWKARELIMNLQNSLANMPLEVVHGKCVVEVRMQGVHKGNLVHRMNELGLEYDFILSAGDDTTDEYLFAALPESVYSIKVGLNITHAHYRVNSVKDIRRLLKRLIEARSQDGVT